MTDREKSLGNPLKLHKKFESGDKNIRLGRVTGNKQLCFQALHIYLSYNSHTCSSIIILKSHKKSTHNKHTSHLVKKPTMWFPTRSDTNQSVQLQKQARSLKFWS